MGKYTVIINEFAQKDLKKIYKSGNKKLIRKLEDIFEELTSNPYEGIGKPEMLKNNYSGFWSRRLDLKNRLIYKIKEDIVTVEVISVLGHYNDK